MSVAREPGSARRRRERRFRSTLRQERLAVAVALAGGLHHSACRTSPEEKEEVEQYKAPRGQTPEQGGEHKTSRLEVLLLVVGGHRLSSILCRRGQCGARSARAPATLSSYCQQSSVALLTTTLRWRSCWRKLSVSATKKRGGGEEEREEAERMAEQAKVQQEEEPLLEEEETPDGWREAVNGASKS